MNKNISAEINSLSSTTNSMFVRRPIAAAISTIILGGAMGQALALPSNPDIVAGSATIVNPDATTMQVNQSTDKLILNFEDFGIDAGEWVNFIQPGANSVALNRVIGGNPSLILGRLTANGQVFILNQQGVVFGQGAQVDVGGLVAGTMNIADQDFLDGNYVFNADGATGTVLNEGDLNAADGGYVILLGTRVENDGIITATLGTVALIAGEEVSLDFGGDGLISYSIERATMDALAANRGVIQADGGQVYMAASTAGDLMTTVVNNEGIVQARGLVERDGRIVLSSNATVENTGNLDASATGGDGGSVAMSGARVGQFGRVSANGAGEGSGGSIDISADQVIALGPTSFTVANAGDDGDGGDITVFTVGEALFRPGAQIEARGGSNTGNGGFVEVSGKDYVEIQGRVNTSATDGVSGTFLIDPTDITIHGTNATVGMVQVGNDFNSDGSTGTSNILDDDLLALLDTTSVVVTTQTGAELLTAPSGADIIVDTFAVLDASILTNTDNNSLTLQAGEDIMVLGTVNMDGGDLILQAGVRTDINTGTVITIGNITANNLVVSTDSLISLGNLTVNSVDLSINQTGPIIATNSQALVVKNASTNDTGNINITTTAGSITIDSATGGIDAGPNTATLVAAAGIMANADDAAAEIEAATVDLTSGTAGIGVSGAKPIDIRNATQVTATSDDAGIDIDLIGTSTATVSVTLEDKAAGSIALDQESGLQKLVVTSAITAGGDISFSSKDTDMDVTVVTAGGANDITLIVTDSNASADEDISLGAVSAGDRVTITSTATIKELGADATVDLTAVEAVLTAAGTIGTGATIETDVDNLASFDAGLDISNTGSINITDLTALSGVTSTGSVSIVADNTITITQPILASGTVTVSATTGNIVAAAENAAAEVAGTTISLNAVNGDVGEAAGGGAIDVDGSVAVNADVSTGNGDIYVDAIDDIPLGHLNAGTGTVTVNATASADGEITDGNGFVTNITAATATLAADDAIGKLAHADGIFAGANNGANDALETAVTTFASVVASATGASINISDSGLPTFTAALDAGTALPGSMLLTVSGSLTVNGTVADFVTDAGDSAGFVSTGGADVITIPNATGAATVTDLLISAFNIVDVNAGGAIDSISATNVQIVSGSAVTVTASTIGTLDASSTGGALSFAGETDGLILADLNSDGTAVSTTGANNITIAADGSITVSDTVSAVTGAISITADSGNDSVNTLQVAGTVTSGSTITLSGGTDNNDTIDIDVDVTAGGSLTIQEATSVDLAAGVDLQGAGVDLNTNVTGILLSGADATTVTITSSGDANTITTAAVTATNNPNLTLSSEGALTVNNIAIGTGALAATVDNDDDSTSTLLVSGTPTAGTITLSGGGTGTNDTIDVDADVNATAGALTIQNASLVDLATDIDLTGVSVAASSNVTDVRLTGAGTSIVTSTGGNVALGPVTDSANANLTVSSTADVTLAAITLDNGGAGIVSVTADDDNDTSGSTLTVGGVIVADGAVTLSGGTDTNDIINVDADVTSSAALTVQNASLVDLAAAVDLTGLSVTATSGITSIDLSGAGTNVVTSTGGNVALGAVTDSADANLTVSSTANVTLAAITLNNGGAGVVFVTADDDDNSVGAVLTANGTITADGAVTLTGGTDTDEIIDINADITSAGALAIQNATTVDIAGDLSLQGVGADASTGVTSINLSGANGTTVTITSTGNGNTVTTAAVTATNNPNLTLVSDDGLTIGNTTNIGTGTLSATVDNNDDSTSILLVSGSPTAGSITLSGGGTGTTDTIDINADVNATTGALTIQNANLVDLAANIDLTGLSVTASTNITSIDLSGAGTSIVTSTGGNVTLGAVTDSADANLTVSSTANVTLAAITLDNGGAGVVSITADDDDNTVGALLTANGAITADGAVTLTGGTDTDESIDINANITAGGALSIQNATTVDIAGGLSLQGVAVDANTGVTGILLSGADASTVTITSIGNGNTVTTAAVTATNNPNLTLVSDDGLTISNTTNIGSGTLSATADNNNDSTSTLLVSGSPTAGTITLSGGGTGTNDTIDVNADVIATAGALTIQNANLVDLAANVDLTGVSVAASSNVTSINLSGAGTNIITSTGGNVGIGPVTDSAAANLTVSSTADVILATITLNFGGAGAVSVTADDDDDTVGATLTAGGAIVADGAVTLSGGTDNDDTIDVNADVTSSAALTVQNASLVDLAAAVDLTGLSVTATSGITSINLSGAGTNIVTSTGGNVALGAVIDSADANLTVSSTADVTLAAITLNNGGAGIVSVTADDDDNSSGVVLTANGAITADGAVTLTGGTDTNETIDINADITSGGALAIRNATTIDIAGGLSLQGVGVDANTGVTGILLSGADATTVTIISTGNGNTITTAAVTATNNPNLTLISDDGLTISNTTNIGTGALSATVDNNDDSTSVLLVSGSPTAGTITLSGGGTGTNDTIDVDADVNATTGALTIQNANLTDLAANVDLTGVSVAASNNIASIDLSGVGTSIVTSTGGNVDLAAVTDSADASLVVSSEANATLAGVVLDDAAAVNGLVTVTADSGNDTVGAVITVNGVVDADGAVTLSGGTTVDDIMDINADVTSDAALLLQNSSGVDLAANVGLTGLSVTANAANNVTGINLSGTGTNLITSTGGDVDLIDVTDSGDASLTVSSTANVTLATVTLDDAFATNGNVTVTADSDNAGASALTANGAIAADGTVTLSGGTDNNDTIDVNANVTAGGVLTVQNALELDLAANIALQGASVAADTGTNALTALDLSGPGTNTITSTSGNVTLATVGDTADASLTVSSAADATLAAITLDDAGTTNGALSVTADDNDDTVGSTLTVGAAITTNNGAVTLSGGTDNDDTIDINATVTAGGALTIQNVNLVDVAASFNLVGSSVTASSNVGTINLSGVGTNTVTSNTGNVDLAAVTDSADASLVVSSEANATLAGVVLDDAAAVNGLVTVTADSGDDTVGAVLTINGIVDADGVVTLSGGATVDDTMDINADITSDAALLLQNSIGVDLAANVDLTGLSVTANAAGNVTGISLSGAGTNIVTSTGGAVDLTDITDSGDASLTVSSTANVTLATVTLDDTGTTNGNVMVTADDNDDTVGSTLAVNGAIAADGTITLSGGTDTDDTIDVNANVTAGGVLTVQNALALDLAADIALQGASVAADTATNGLTAIDLSGAGTNTITSISGNISLAEVGDTADASLTVSSAADVTLAAIVLDDAGAANGTLSVTADDNDDTVGSTLTVGAAITTNNGAVTLSGGTDNDDTIDINATVTAGGALTIQNANLVDVAATFNLVGSSVTASSNVGTINLSGAGTNTVTSNTGDVDLAAVTDSADASLVVSSEANVTLAGVVLDDTSTANGTVTVTADSGDDTVGAAITVNGVVDADGAVTLSGGVTVDDTMDINADITSDAALLLQNTSGVDLAANVDLTGLSVTANAAGNVTGINLSGAGTNIVTSTGGAVDLIDIIDSGDASLTVSSTANVTLATVTLDDTGTTNGNVMVTADDNDDTVGSTLAVNGAIAADGTITLSGGTDTDDTIDVNANVTAGGVLTVQNALEMDLAADIALQGASVAADTATNGLTAIDLSGAGSNTVTSTSGNVALAAVDDTADASLTVSSAADATLAAITLDDAGAVNGVLLVTADDDDDTAGSTLTVGGAITTNNGAVTLSGGTDNDDTIDINANVTSAAALTIQNANLVDLAANIAVQGTGVTASSNVGTINLSGAGTNTVTSTVANVDLAAVTDSGDASLVVSSESNATLAGVVLDDTGTTNGTVTVTADSGDNTAGAAITINGVVDADGAVTLSGGTTVDDTMDINADVTSDGALLLKNTSGVDLAANVDLTGLSVTANAANNVTGINQSGAGVNIVTSTGGNVDLVDITDSGDASLLVSSTADVTLATVTLDDTGTTNGNVTVTADDDDNTAGAILAVNGAMTADGAITLSGGTDNDDTIDINAVITAGGVFTAQNANVVDLAANINVIGSSVTASSNVITINLSGAGTNTVTSTSGNTDLAMVTDSADASLVVSSEASATLGGVVLDDAGAVNGTVLVTADSDDDTVASVLTVNGVIDADGAVTLSGGATVDDTMDINADVTSDAALLLQNTSGIDLAADVDLTGLSVTANAASNVTGINLSGAGTNIVTSTGGDVDLITITDTGDANLTVSATDNVILTAITLDNGGAGAVSVTADDDDNTVNATLTVGGAITADGAVTLAGGTDNDDTIDVNASITSGGAINVQNANVVQLADVTLDARGGAVNIDSTTNSVTTISLDGGTGATLQTTTAGDNDVAATIVTSAANESLTVSSRGTFDLQGAINLGTGTLTVTVDSNNNGTETLAIDNTINAANVILTAGGTGSTSNITQSAVVTATTLTATATNGMALTAANVVSTVELINSNAGNIQYNNDIGSGLTVSGTNSASAGTFSATEATSGLTVGAGVVATGISTDGGAINLTTTLANQLLTLNEAVISNSATAAGAGVIITADRMALRGGGNGRIDAGTAGTVTLVQVTATDAIDLGLATDTSTTTLNLSTNELTNITASRLLIGAATAGAITVSSDVDISSVDTTHLTTASTVTGTAGGIVTGATTAGQDLAITAGGVVNMTDTNNNVQNLAVSNTGFDVTFVEADGFEVDTVDGVSGITGDDITISAISGATPAGAIAINQAITATGNVSVTAVDDISQAAGINVTTSGAASSIAYQADSDDSGDGGISMGLQTAIETAGNAGNNITLTAGTATGGDDITVASLDAGALGNVTVRTYAESIRNDGRESTFITGDTITLLAAKNVGGDVAITLTGSKTDALEITTTGLTGITATGTAGHVQLMAADANPLIADTFIGGLAGAGMSAGTQKQIFVGVLDGALEVDAANPIDLGNVAGKNNDLFLFTGGENRDVDINANITLNRDDTDTTIQRAVVIQASGDITQLDTTRIIAFDVVAQAPTGSVRIYTGTDLLEATGGEDQTVFIDNVTPVDSKFKDPGGADTTRLLNDIITSGSGDITIVNDGSLTIDKIVQTTGTGDVTISASSATGASSPLYITSQIDAGGNVVLTSDGDLTTDGIYIQDGGTIQSNAIATSGTITITSNDNIYMDATAVVLSLASGANGKITITADSNGDVSGTGSGEITMVSGARITASGGAEIDVDAGGNIALSELNSGVVAGGNVTVDSSGGSITDVNGAGLNIEGGDISLSASGAISLDIIPAGDLTVDSTVGAANGDIDITSLLGSLNVVTVDAGTGAVLLVSEDGGITDQNLAGVTNITGGTVSLISSSIIDMDVEASTSIAVTIQDAGGTAQNGPVTLRSPAGLPLDVLNASGGTVTLTAVTGITDTNAATLNITGGSIVLVAGTGGIDTDVNATIAVNADAGGAVGNTIDLTSTAGALPVGTIITDAGTVNLTSAAGITRAGGTITASALNLVAAGDVGSAIGELVTNVDTLNTPIAIAGDLYLLEISALTVGSVSTSAGSINLQVGGALTATTLTATGAVVLEVAGAVWLTDVTGNSVDIDSGGVLTAGTIDSTTTVELVAGDDATLADISGSSINADITGALTATTIDATAAVLLEATGDMDLTDITANSVEIDAGGVLTAASVDSDSTVDIVTGDDSTLGAVLAVGDVTIDAGGSLDLGTLNTSGDVTLDLDGALTDGNGATNNVTADSLTILGGNAVTGIETVVSALSLTTAATSITNTGDVTVMDSTVTGQLDLIVGSVLTLKHINAADQTVNIDVSGSIKDGNSGDVNITAATLNISATGDVNDIETVVGNLGIDAGSASIDNTGTLELANSEIDGQFDLSNDGIMVLNSITADVVNITSTGEITDGNAIAINVTADSLTISGGSEVTGIETAVSSLTLNTGTTSINNSTTLTVEDSTLSGSLDLVSSGAQLTLSDVEVMGTASITNLNGDVVLGDLSVSETITINSGGDIIDGNADIVNITSVLESVLQASGTIGSLEDAIEVNVGGRLSVLAGATDNFMVSANINGKTDNLELFIPVTTPGLVLLGSPSRLFSAHIVGGTGANEVIGAIGGDLTLLDHGGGWTTLFQFEATSAELYSTDSVLLEIQYGSEGAAPIIEVEDIVTSPITSLDFDTWLDDRLAAALQELSAGGK